MRNVAFCVLTCNYLCHAVLSYVAISLCVPHRKVANYILDGKKGRVLKLRDGLFHPVVSSFRFNNRFYFEAVII